MDDACRERNEGAAAECSFHGDRCNFFSSNPASPSCPLRVLPLGRLLPPRSPRFFAERESEFSKGNDLRYISKGVFAGARVIRGPLCVCLGDDVARKKTRELARGPRV